MEKKVMRITALRTFVRTYIREIVIATSKEKDREKNKRQREKWEVYDG
ncbi:hypothetical protein [Emergencia sp. 1XD21-10]|nr:hypothetical protein [Emergencia sp. 1XD21-10]